MKRVLQGTIAAVLMLGAVAAAKADIGAFSVSEVPPAQPSPQKAAQPADAGDVLPLGLGGRPVALEGPVTVPPKPLASLPAAPASLSLVLCGLGSLGAWQLGRAAKSVHLLHVPDWYHIDGPGQVGHTFAADPDCNGLHALCLFDQPVEEAPPLLVYRSRCASPPILLPQCILTSEVPTGPPFLSR